MMKFPKFVRIAVSHLPGICELGFDSSGKLRLLRGAERGFILFLSEIFQFSYELVQPSDMGWGTPLQDGNWTGLIGMLQRGEADMALCSMSITRERQEVVSFTREYDIQHLVFATRHPESLPQVKSIWLPFSDYIWLAVLCLFIFIPLLWKYLLKVQEGLGDIYMNVLASAVKLSIIIKCKRRCGEYIFLGTWFWSVAIFTACYSAVLLSFVTLPLDEDVIRDIPRMIKAVTDGTYKCYAFQGTATTTSLTASNNHQISQLGATIVENNWIVKPQSGVVRNLLQEKNVAVIGTSKYFKSQFHDEFALSKDFFFPVRIGIALNKDFCCKEPLDKKVRQVLYAGFYQEWSKRYSYVSFVRSNTSDKFSPDTVKPIKLKDMAGALTILVLGYAAACVVFVVEMMFGKLKNRQHIRNNVMV